jgi:RNA polymerase sigma-70 factor (ECF subfamily)
MADPEVLLADHLGLLRAYVRRRLGPKMRVKETSLDLAQSVCREALKDLSRFEDRGEGSFRRWLLTRAENKIKDRGRFWRRERRAVDREVSLAREGQDTGSGSTSLGDQLATYETPQQRAAAREELTRLEAAFGALPEDYREVVVLSKLEGLPHDQVAERLGRSNAATRTLLCRALARLSTALEDND